MSGCGPASISVERSERDSCAPRAEEFRFANFIVIALSLSACCVRVFIIARRLQSNRIYNTISIASAWRSRSRGKGYGLEASSVSRCSSRGVATTLCLRTGCCIFVNKVQCLLSGVALYLSSLPLSIVSRDNHIRDKHHTKARAA